MRLNRIIVDLDDLNVYGLAVEFLTDDGRMRRHAVGIKAGSFPLEAAQKLAAMVQCLVELHYEE